MRHRLMLAAMAALILMAGCSNSEPGGASPSRPPAPDDVVVPVAFGLPRDARGLAEEVRLISDPDSSRYQQWLTADQVAQRFGSSERDSQQLLDTLEAAGFKGDIDPTRGFISGTMTVGQVRDLLETQIVQFSVNSGAQTVIGPDTATQRLKGPPGSSGVVGLTASLATNSAPPAQQTDQAVPAPNFDTCEPLPDLEYLTSGQFGLTADYPSRGNGVHVAMLEVDQVDPKVLTYLAECYGFAKPAFDVVQAGPINPSAFSGEVESDLDLALLVVGAPQLRKITVFQSNSVTSIFFPTAAAVRESFAPDGPSIVTTSVGFCERDVPANDVELTEWVLMTAAATGVTVTASTGDSGSSSCAPGNTTEQPQYPSSSPYVTGVGGTQFATNTDLANSQRDPQAVRQPGSQVVWNGGPKTSAGGGSTTSTLDRPWYQDGVYEGQRRSVPDVAYLASPFALSPLLLCDASGNCRSYGVGGTSAAAPAFAAALARIASDTPASAATPDRYGLLNPTIYAMTQDEPSNTLDVTQGDNDIYSVGCCTAKDGYDSASGWGLLDVTAIDRYLRDRSRR